MEAEFIDPAIGSLKTKAVLVFAAALFEDLDSRKLPVRFSSLLKMPSLDSSVTAKADIHVFTTALPSDTETFQERTDVTFHLQKGATFGERLRHAIKELCDQGYQQIAVVGRDCPELESADIHTALDQLSKHRLVIGPDHRGGCYLIAIHTADRSKLYGVRWQVNTDRAQLENLFGPEATFLLPVKHDLDSIADIRLLARTNSECGIRARVLLMQYKQAFHMKMESFSVISLPVDLERSCWQIPPPLLN